MSDVTRVNNDWIKLRIKKKYKDMPGEIRIDIDGKVYIDGEPYDEKTSKYKNLNVEVEHHSRMSAGEETQKIIEQSKKAKKGDMVIIRDEEGPDRKELTTVKF
jgi:hypothetical protein